MIIGDGFFWGGASEGGYRNVRQSMIIGDSFGGGVPEKEVTGMLGNL